MITVAAPFKTQLRCLHCVDVILPEKLCAAKTHFLLTITKRAPTIANKPKHNSCIPRPSLRVCRPDSTTFSCSCVDLLSVRPSLAFATPPTWMMNDRTSKVTNMGVIHLGGTHRVLALSFSGGVVNQTSLPNATVNDLGVSTVLFGSMFVENEEETLSQSSRNNLKEEKKNSEITHHSSLLQEAKELNCGKVKTLDVIRPTRSSYMIANHWMRNAVTFFKSPADIERAMYPRLSTVRL